MRILVDINHPAHVHLFRNAIREWQARGHQVLITARDKDVTLELLKRYGLEYIPSAGTRHGLSAFLFGVLELDWKVWQAARAFDPDVMIGSSFAIAHTSKFLRAKSIVFGEDSIAASRLFWTITIPFADLIAVPDSIADNFGPNRVKYPSFHELAYLHPHQFTPDPSVLEAEGLKKGEPFSLLRFVSFGASHDVNQSGLDHASRDQLLDILKQKGRVLITAEGRLPTKLEPFRIRISPEKLHHLLAFSTLLVSDSQTMTIEAAALGVPSIRYNSFVGRTPVIEELETRYQLTFGFHPGQQEQMLAKVKEILADPLARPLWEERRTKMLADKLDLTQWMVFRVEEFAQNA